MDEAVLVAAGFPKDCLKERHPQLVTVPQKAALRASAIAVSDVTDGTCPPVFINITSAGRLEAPK